jgi:hypothetical protein
MAASSNSASALNQFLGVISKAILEPEPADLTNEYNTKLTSQEEETFQNWAKANHRQNDSFDYDLRGAWKADAQAAADGHLPDTWKKPNHPTFSNESMYSNDQVQGGSWVKGANGDYVGFMPSQRNILNTGVMGLKDHMRSSQRNMPLIFPDDFKLPTLPELPKK